MSMPKGHHKIGFPKGCELIRYKDVQVRYHLDSYFHPPFVHIRMKTKYVKEGKTVYRDLFIAIPL